MAWAAVRSKPVVQLLLIHCFYEPHIVCGSSVFVFVLLCITLCSFLLCNHLEEEENLVAFLLLSYRCIATVNVLWLFIT